VDVLGGIGVEDGLKELEARRADDLRLAYLDLDVVNTTT